MKTVPVKEEAKTTMPAGREHKLFQTLQREMNRLFEEFKGNFGFAHPSWMEPMVDFQAKVDIKDNDKELMLTADLPGVDIKDIEVSVTDEAIVIKGEKRTEKEESDKGFYRMERSYGCFHRMLPLPCAVDKDNVSASYKNGVLTVTMPKTGAPPKDEKKVEVIAG